MIAAVALLVIAGFLLAGAAVLLVRAVLLGRVARTRPYPEAAQTHRRAARVSRFAVVLSLTALALSQLSRVFA